MASPLNYAAVESKVFAASLPVVWLRVGVASRGTSRIGGISTVLEPVEPRVGSASARFAWPGKQTWSFRPQPITNGHVNRCRVSMPMRA